MATTTTKLGLTKPAGSDNVDIAVLNTNSDKIDSAIGVTVCTSTTRPATPFEGQNIYETDTKITYVYQGGAWKAVVSKEAVDAVLPIDTDGYSYKQTVTFTANGTFTKASYSWLRAVRVKCVGGGGASGAAIGAGTGQSQSAGGGGGAYAESFILVGSLGTSETVTVGTAGVGGALDGGDGGNSSFGTLVVAEGGKGGERMTSSTGTQVAVSGVGGLASASTGDIKISGSDGTNGRTLSGVVTYTADGGGSQMAGSTRSRSTAGTGQAGKSYGGGASGAVATATTNNGGNGAAGIVIVELYG